MGAKPRIPRARLSSCPNLLYGYDLSIRIGGVLFLSDSSYAYKSDAEDDRNKVNAALEALAKRKKAR